MKIKSWLLIIAMVTILLVAAGCGSTSTPSTGGTSATQPPAAVTEAQPATQPPAAPPATLDGKALAQERCTACHSFDRIQNAQKTADEWKTTVDRMIGKGAQLNADEAIAVVDYLSKTYGK